MNRCTVHSADKTLNIFPKNEYEKTVYHCKNETRSKTVHLQLKHTSILLNSKSNIVNV